MAAEMSRREHEYTAAALLGTITEAHVKTLLGGIAQNIDVMNRPVRSHREGHVRPGVTPMSGELPDQHGLAE